MPYLIDRTGEIHGKLKIVGELGGGKVVAECIKCETPGVYFKTAVLRGEALCKNKNCINSKNVRFINRVGEVHGRLEIVKEIGKNKVEARCIKCKTPGVYEKKSVVNGISLCKNKECINSRRTQLINTVGKVYGKLKVIEEIRGGKVRAACIKCGTEDIYYKKAVLEKNAVCHNKNCENSMIGLVNREGEKHGKLVITEEIGGGKVKAKCVLCGTEGKYAKINVINERAICKNENCINSKRKTFINRAGEVHGSLKVIEDKGCGKLKTQCLKCGYCDDNQYKQSVIECTAMCKNCGIGGSHFKNIEGHTINNITVLNYEYKGRDGNPYYTCMCNKCQEEMLLNYDEIFTYTCTKEK